MKLSVYVQDPPVWLKSRVRIYYYDNDYNNDVTIVFMFGRELR